MSKQKDIRVPLSEELHHAVKLEALKQKKSVWEFVRDLLKEAVK